MPATNVWEFLRIYLASPGPHAPLIQRSFLRPTSLAFPCPVRFLSKPFPIAHLLYCVRRQPGPRSLWIDLGWLLVVGGCIPSRGPFPDVAVHIPSPNPALAAWIAANQGRFPEIFTAVQPVIHNGFIIFVEFAPGINKV